MSSVPNVSATSDTFPASDKSSVSGTSSAYEVGVFLFVNDRRKLLWFLRLELQTDALIVPNNAAESVKHRSVNSTMVSFVLTRNI